MTSRVSGASQTATAATAAAPAGVGQIVTFRIGPDLFAADVRAVERVLRYQAPTPVPNVPSWVCGVVEYLRRVVPVIDLRSRFGLAREAPARDTRTIVFNAAGSWIAGVVDAVLDVTILERGRLEPPPPLFRGLATEYLQGIVRREGQLVILLDADHLLSATERLTLERVSGGEPVPAMADG
jgi:purine-binding chemotaxis protein CheW